MPVNVDSHVEYSQSKIVQYLKKILKIGCKIDFKLW